jgi:tetratricopeptide (TPR) repeat protein
MVEKKESIIMDDTLLKKGIEAAKKDNRQEALECFRQVLLKDPNNINAWLWLASVLDDRDKQIDCLNRVLRIDPNHEVAHKALKKLQQTLASSDQKKLEQKTTKDEIQTPRIGAPAILQKPEYLSKKRTPKKHRFVGVSILGLLSIVCLMFGYTYFWKNINHFDTGVVQSGQGSETEIFEPYTTLETKPVLIETETPPSSIVGGVWGTTSAFDDLKDGVYPDGYYTLGTLSIDFDIIEFLPDGTARFSFDNKQKYAYEIVDGKKILFTGNGLRETEYLQIESFDRSELIISNSLGYITTFTRLPIFKNFEKNIQGIWEINYFGYTVAWEFDHGQLYPNGNFMFRDINKGEHNTYYVENGMPYFHRATVLGDDAPNPIFELSPQKISLSLFQGTKLPLHDNFARNIIGRWKCDDTMNFEISKNNLRFYYDDGSKEINTPYTFYGHVGLIFPPNIEIKETYYPSYTEMETMGLSLNIRAPNEIYLPDFLLTCFRQP